MNKISGFYIILRNIPHNPVHISLELSNKNWRMIGSTRHKIVLRDFDLVLV
jgi:hypothetical protein